MQEVEILKVDKFKYLRASGVICHGSNGEKESLRKLVFAWFGDSGSKKKTGGRAGGGREEDVKIYIGSEHYGKDRN